MWAEHNVSEMLKSEVLGVNLSRKLHTSPGVRRVLQTMSYHMNLGRNGVRNS